MTTQYKKMFLTILIFLLTIVLSGCELKTLVIDKISNFEKYFGCKYIRVCEKGSYYFIDEKGNNPFNKVFGGATDFENGRAIVRDIEDSKQYYIDLEGNAISKKYENIQKTYDQISFVEDNNLWYILDKDLNLLVEEGFDYYYVAHGGLIVVYREDTIVILDYEGKCIAELPRGFSFSCLHGYYRFFDGKTSFLYDKKGELLFSEQGRIGIFGKNVFGLYTGNYTDVILIDQNKKTLLPGYIVTYIDETYIKARKSNSEHYYYCFNKELEMIAEGVKQSYGSEDKYTITSDAFNKNYRVFDSQCNLIIDKSFEYMKALGDYIIAYDIVVNETSNIRETIKMYIYNLKGDLLLELDDEQYVGNIFDRSAVYDLIKKDVYIKDNEGNLAFVNLKNKSIENLNIKNVYKVINGLAICYETNVSNGIKIINLKTKEVVDSGKRVRRTNENYLINNYYIIYEKNAYYGMIDIYGNKILDCKYRCIYDKYMELGEKQVNKKRTLSIGKEGVV